MPSIALRVRPRLLACAAVLLSLSAPALAQRVVEGDLQQQMSPTEFKAAGLDKLSAAELATLNRWLQGKVEAATTQAVAAAREEGRQEVIKKNRGFLDFGSSEPIESTLQGEFRGFGQGRRFLLRTGVGHGKLGEPNVVELGLGLWKACPRLGQQALGPIDGDGLCH